MIADLHIHSKYSFDSFLSPKNIIKEAKKHKIDVIAITDHNTIRGGLETLRINLDSKISVIVGSEIHTEIGDIIGLYLNEEIKSRLSLDVIDEIKSQGGIVVLPHPFRGHNLNEKLINQCDAIEIFNSRSSEIENQLSLELAKQFNKPFTAGSDAHLACEIGLVKVVLKMDELTERISFSSLNEDLIGTYSSKCLKHCSQLIKSLKTKNLKKIPYDFFNASYSIINRN
ncbi:PHP-like protein [Methanospirillum hungatei JF-1]|uniref:PHP-like protein n=1 Tax=Methanospirillum hungatei JF-1 (strain ATCC 27890 / DSM 864 / NBRC 100397 / JF-1) TaxID=323259 RepID=Q2FN21_METHJ|nr:PHP domain-containing protein [Methanospirillum hungatei]ABD40150.1 PHP-like protein [Methanospirillum hungatei JF-1]